MKLTPTSEQAAIIDACRAGSNVVIEAGAGTGKTKTLEMAADQMGGRLLYLAYNKSTADEARSRFPKHVDCRTRHSLAYAAVGRAYSNRLNAPRQTMRVVAKIIGADPVRAGGITVADTILARWAMDAIQAFCNSADATVNINHVHVPATFNETATKMLRDYVLKLATKAWADVTSNSGQLRWTHDFYLKIWAAKEPMLRYDAVLLDEAQDSTPVITKVVQDQMAQRIAVGDPNQQLYSWLGAVDALADWPADIRLMLTESWRFGPEIADEANNWLGFLESPMTITGRGSAGEVFTTITAPDAVLSRGNATAITHGMTAMQNGRKVGVVGGIAAIKALTSAAFELKAGNGTTHPELVAFGTWDELVEHVRSGSDTDLGAFVSMIDQFGTAKVWAAINGFVPEAQADLVLSTIHKAKGLEWPRVQLADDLARPTPEVVPEREELMLGYVATTRARSSLGKGRSKTAPAISL